MSQFPSLEDFEGGATVAVPGDDLLGDDLMEEPASDLASRERAALGEDAQYLKRGQEEVEQPSITGIEDDAEQEDYADADVDAEQETEREEPDVVREWRQRRDLQIEQRDKYSAERKKETIKNAKTAIDDFYDNYNEKRDRAIARTREEQGASLANQESTSAGGTAWERICKLADVGEKTKGSSTADTARFRELLLSLKGDAQGPGA